MAQWRPPPAAVRWAAAVSSGILIGLAFPKPDLHLLVWIGLVPLLWAVRGASITHGWWLGIVAGFTYRLVVLYWLVDVMVVHGGLHLSVAMLAAASLVLFLASFVGLFAALARWLEPSGPGAAVPLAAAWVTTEYIQTLLLGGFPWALLGYAAGRSLPMMQTADLAGVYGLGFLAVLVNAAVAAALAHGRRATRVLITALAVVVSAAVYGSARLAAAPPVAAADGSPSAAASAADANDAPTAGDGAVEVVLVQGNVAQDQKWDPASRARVLADHIGLSRRGATDATDLVIWPESSVPTPYGFARDPEIRAAVTDLARELDAPILVGTPHLRPAGDELIATNAALLVGADGSWSQLYEKVHLVPYGEYVPFRRWLPWIAPLVQQVADFYPGEPDQPLLERTAEGVPAFGVAICYEIIYPALIRSQVRRGAVFLVTITNDAWFGTSSAPFQHFAMARMRAVESRRYLARAANTGISGVIDPWGRVVLRTALNEADVVRATLLTRRQITPYERWGDLFVAVCVLLVVAGAVVQGRQGGAP